MKEGTGLVPFSETYPDRFFDVGIAEQHGVTFAAGLASQGMRPVVAIYSSFLQRAFDQIIHDVCIQNLPVIFAVDRAGLVGADGETHQGIFDLSFLSAIPNLTVFAPKDGGELQEAFRFALKQKGPMAIRYPRGEAPEMEEFTPIRMGKGEVLVREKGIALLAVGSMVETAMAVHDRLERDHIPSTVVNMRFINPWDQELVRSLLSDHGQVVTLEENVRNGGFGEKIGAALQEWSYRGKWTCISLPNAYVEHGNVQTLKKTLGLDTDAVWEKIIKDMQNEQ